MRQRQALTRGGEEELRSALVVVASRASSRACAFVRARSALLLRRAPSTRPNRGQDNADQAAVHDGGQITLREDPVPPRHLRDQEPGRLGRLPARGLRGPRALEPGRGRHPGAEVFPQGRRAGAPEARRGDPGPVLAVALGPRRARAGRAARSTSASSARPTPARCSTGSPAPGPTGAGRAATSPARTTRAPSSTSTATCWPCRSARPTARSGSTPACTGPTASTAPARATTTSTTSPAS